MLCEKMLGEEEGNEAVNILLSVMLARQVDAWQKTDRRKAHSSA